MAWIYDCQRCGIRVMQMTGNPDMRSLLCAECRFLLSIPDEETRKEMKARLKQSGNEEVDP